jgi:serine/threonine-protein kinase
LKKRAFDQPLAVRKQEPAVRDPTDASDPVELEWAWSQSAVCAASTSYTEAGAIFNGEPMGSDNRSGEHGRAEDVTADIPSGDVAQGPLFRGGAQHSGASTTRFTPGTLLMDRYRLVLPLGRGGMGEVYRADDLELGQAVALKFLPPELAADTTRLTMLRAEVASARQVSHPNVCRVFDLARVETPDGPLAFLCMEFVDGSDLASLLTRAGRLAREKASDVARQLCFGLAAVHDAGFIHRDLKPANVLVDGRGRVRLADFGIALDQTSHQSGPAGTPQYMAPEVIRGERASRRSDIYALGLVLYEVYTGKPAKPSIAKFEDLRKSLETADTQPARPSSLVEDLAPGVEQLIMECLDPDPAVRPPSPIAVAARLPGGDPLAAALAAGETPSPELVAASGSREGLSMKTTALMLLGIVASVLVFIASNSDRALLAWTRPAKSVEVLTDRARELVKSLGFEKDPVDWHGSVSIRTTLLTRAKDLPDEQYREVLTGMPGAYVFWYRQSMRPLEPTTDDRTLRAYQPPHFFAGDLVVQMDTLGRLDRLQAVPLMFPPATPVVLPGPVPILFEAAGLDLSRFDKVAPQRRCPVDADEVLAWTGPARADFVPVREGPDALRVIVHAGLADGQAVYFTVDEVGAGPNYVEVLPARPPGSATLVNASFAVLIGGLVIAFTAMAVRNLRSGRGDPRGATRAALFLLMVYAIWCVCTFDRQPSPQQAFFGVSRYAAALWVAVMFWLYYVAMEPAARRIWPHAMITWSRLVAGRVRDPAVGRDVLKGAFIGTCAVAVSALILLAVQTVADHPVRPPIQGSEILYGPAASVAEVTGRIIPGLLYAVSGMFSLVLGRMLFRSTPLAMLFALVILLAIFLDDIAANPYRGSLPFLALGIVTLFMIRVGFLCGIAAMVAAFLTSRLAIGWDWSTPWGTIAWGPAATLVTIALASAWTATRSDRRVKVA